MKLNRLLVILILLFLAACKKDKITAPNQSSTGTVTNPPTPVAFRVNSLLQSNMVVQRDKPFVIWGNATYKEKITINVSWNQTGFSAVADDQGNWQVSIPASPVNNTPQTITITGPDNSAIMFENILIGDVWVCSGQSNMVYPMDSIAPFRGVLNFQQEIAAANYPAIRMMNEQLDAEVVPQNNLILPAYWEVCSPATVDSMSAVAYYFARKLNTALNVPIGLIIAADNGSFCQDWTNEEVIESNSTLSLFYASHSTLYNGMINPLINLSIKGFIWYQGENNGHDVPASNYTLLNDALIAGWRSKFNQPDLPFYLVQIAPFAEDYYTTTPVGGDTTLDYYGKFREAQSNIRKVAGTGMAVTMDVGEAANHHPRDKEPVGERLALLALNNTYGQNVQCIGPQYASFTAVGAQVTVNFVANTANGLTTIGNQPLKQYFFVSGADQVFREGHAVISGNNIVITAPASTPLPVQAVRYAFTNAPVTNLQNSAGLPAEPFRTDNWSN
jgi:sialate O-acetylesterase